MSKENGGPAFPAQIEWGPEGGLGFDGEAAWKVGTSTFYRGMTLRAYAAIKLKVPDSGIDWLDEMIKKSLGDDFAAKAMAALISLGDEYQERAVCESAYLMADAMLAERSKP